MNNINNTILFVSTTKRNDLCSVSAYINPEEKHDASAKSDFHWQILKCRQIIFKFDELIAAPAQDNQIQIHIIMRKSFYVTGKLTSFLEKLKMPGHQVQQLTNGIYESCLRYTIIAHIAPEWNQLQNYLLQGRKFLEANEPLHAVQLEVEVKDNSIYVVLTPMKVKVHRLTLDDLAIPPALSHEFQSQMKMSIHDVTMGAKWVHVLPSMKRGRIMTISHEIPNSCPYKTYKDLKRHWKNSYGYRLPESDDGIFYCTLSFHPMIPTKYTYPSICLKAAPLQFIGRPDERKIVADFLTDLAKKMPNACGNPFQVNGELGYTIPQSMEQMKENVPTSGTLLETHTGLIPKPIYMSVEQEILSSRDMNHNCSQDAAVLRSTQSSCGVSLTTPLSNPISKNPVFSPQSNLQRPGTHSSYTPLNEVVAKRPELAIKKSISISISAILESKQEHITMANDRMSLEKNANFNSIIDRNTLKQSPQKLMAMNMARHSQPFTESAFASNASQSASTPGKNKTEFVESARSAYPRMSLSGKTLAISNLSTTIDPTHLFKGQNQWPVPSQQAFPRMVPTKYTPIFAPPSVPCSQRIQKSKSAAVPKTDSARPHMGSAPVRQGQETTLPKLKIPTFGTQLVSKLPHIKKIPTFESEADFIPPFSTNSKVPASGIQKANKFPAFCMPSESKPLLSTPKNKLAVSGSQKRSASNSPFLDTGEPSSGSKKSRSRPQVQTDINIEELAKLQNLEKANKETLLNWLHEKKVPATTKENKASLISKIKNTLGIKE